ncbi:MAG: DUF1847 domain-containing protein [Salinivirgaceae bacterium]|nr:DUF1847 domain-containing protein [Salinivirgaceae bacterium]
MENIDYTALYTDEDKEILKIAEDSLNPKIDRIQEIIAYCKEANIKNIGIANCTTFNKEAMELESILTNAGFTVAKAHCKLGRVPFDTIIPDYKGLTCNPAGQADFLAEQKTELNIMMGLCLGHDMIFNSKSKAPVTPLIVKDRKLKHQTLTILN